MNRRAGRPARLSVMILALALAGTCLLTRPAPAAAPDGLVDTFDLARDVAPTYGLNDSLAGRQQGWGRGSTYTRTGSGPPERSQVNNSSQPGKLSFWLTPSAVRLDSPVRADQAGTLSISATVDPDATLIGQADDWASINLAAPTSAGYPTDADVQLGLTIKRSGAVMLYERGGYRYPDGLIVPRRPHGYDVTIMITAANGAAPAVAITINGTTLPGVTLAGPVAGSYLFLGAYVSFGGSTPRYEVTTVDNMSVSGVTRYPFNDSFGHAADVAPGYGLNHALEQRQGTAIGQGYTRVPGTWVAGAVPKPEYSQVNHPDHPGRLSFWVTSSAVRLNSRARPDQADRYTVSATVNPDATKSGLTTGDWVSLMLAPSTNFAAVSGYVEDADVPLSITVGRNGAVQLFEAGQPRWSTPLQATPAAYGFRVQLTISGASTTTPTAQVTVNQATRSQPLSVGLNRPYIYLGAYLSNGKPTAPYGEVSTVDDLRISSTIPLPEVARSGTYGTMNDPGTGNRIAEVAGFMNAHWVNIAPTQNPASGPINYDLSVLAGCPVGSCIVYVGNEFFDPVTNARYSSTTRWQQFAQLIAPYQDRILAYYLKDEPYYNGVSASDLQWSATTVQQSITSGAAVDRPIMLTLTLNDITNWAPVPSEVDWLGVDEYSMDEDLLDRAALRLDELTGPGDRTYLMPPNDLDRPHTAGQAPRTDTELAEFQRRYTRVASAHPKVIALLSFGLWVFGTEPEDVPITFALQERLGALVSVR